MNIEQLVEHLKKQNLTEIERATGVRRQSIYALFEKHTMQIDTLNKLLKYLNLENSFERKISTEKIYMNMRYYGAPINNKAEKSLSLEDTLASAIRISQSDDFIASTIPYVIAINYSNLNLTKLFQECAKKDKVRLMGFYLNLAYEFVPNSETKTFLDLLTQMYQFNKQPWESATLNMPSLSIQSHYMQNPIALKWKVYSAGKLEDHLKRWHKWIQLQKTK
jgi:hypothetical protein